MWTTARCRFREVGCVDASVPGSANLPVEGERCPSGMPNPAEHLRIASAGWDRWAPVNLAAIGVHLAGAAGTLVSRAPRAATQKGAGAMSVVKTALTAAALGATAYRTGGQENGEGRRRPGRRHHRTGRLHARGRERGATATARGTLDDPCVHRSAAGGEFPSRRAAEAGFGTARCGCSCARVPHPSA